MADQKWITLQGMVTVEQAKALRDVIDVGLDGVEDEQLHDCLLDTRERLNRAINHIEVEGYAGSGICVAGNEFLTNPNQPIGEILGHERVLPPRVAAGPSAS